MDTYSQYENVRQQSFPVSSSFGGLLKKLGRALFLQTTSRLFENRMKHPSSCVTYSRTYAYGLLP